MTKTEALVAGLQVRGFLKHLQRCLTKDEAESLALRVVANDASVLSMLQLPKGDY